MKRNIIYTAFMISLLTMGGTLITSCEDIDPVQELNLRRVLSPTDLSVRIRNQVNIEASWGVVDDRTQSYTLELYEGTSAEGTPVVQQSGITSTTYTISSGTMGETTYLLRVKAVAEGIEDSKWAELTTTTLAEQIFNSVASADIAALSVTLRWPAGEAADLITLTPAEGSTAPVVTYNVTAEDVANGYAVIEGLTEQTEYTAIMTLNGRTRGTVTFKTAIDTGDMTQIAADADLAAALDAAEEGESFVLMGTNYELGSYAVTKSFSLTSLDPNSPAIVHGRFTVSTPVSSITLANIVFDGQGDTDNILELKDAAANLGTLTIEGCEIRNMGKHIMYNNAKGTFGDIIINNCIIDGIDDGGGDGFDIRGGSLQSLTVTNTTISNGVRTLLRCQVANTVNVTFQNCTFYNICTLDNSNNSGLFQMDKTNDGSLLTVKSCLVYGVGTDSPSATESGTWARSSKFKASAEYSNNYYYNCPNLWASLYKDDHSAVATEADPAFADAANGDFTLTNEDLIYNQVGDPRWY